MLYFACVDLGWVAKRYKTCVDLRANLIWSKVSASLRKYMQGLTKGVASRPKLASTCESVCPGLKTTKKIITQVVRLPSMTKSPSHFKLEERQTV